MSALDQIGASIAEAMAREFDDKVEQVVLHGVRYDQLAMAMIVALRRKVA